MSVSGVWSVWCDQCVCRCLCVIKPYSMHAQCVLSVRCIRDRPSYSKLKKSISNKQKNRIRLGRSFGAVLAVAHHFISDSRVSGVTGTGSEPCASVRPWFSKVQIKEALSSKYFSTSHNFQFTRVCASDPTLSPPPLASWAHAAPGPSLLYTALAFLVVLCRPTLAAQARGGGGGGGGGGEAEDNLRLPINLPICRPPLRSAHCSVPAWSSLPPTSLLGGW